MREIILAYEIEIAWRRCSQRVNHGVCTLDSTKIRINWWRKARKQFFFPFRIPSKRFPLEKKRIRHKIYIKRATAGRRREPRMADLWKKRKKERKEDQSGSILAGCISGKDGNFILPLSFSIQIIHALHANRPLLVKLEYRAACNQRASISRALSRSLR